MQDHLTWQESGARVEVAGELELSPSDNNKALPRPETRRMMLTYEISGNSTHRVDYSRYAHAVWLDAGAWHLLKKGLTGHLDEIFTDGSQAALRAAGTKESLDAMYRHKFGDAAYEDLKRMRSWLMSQGQRSDMLSFLMVEDPYAI